MIKKTYLKLFLITSIVFFFTSVFSQESLPRLNGVNIIEKDTSHINLNILKLKSENSNPDSANRLTKKALKKIQSGNLKEALFDIDNSISIDPLISFNYTLKGICKFYEDSVKESIRLFRKSIALRDSNALNFLYLGKAHYRLNRIFEAMEFYNTCMNTDPSLCEAFFDMANISFIYGDLVRADSLYNITIYTNPDFLMAYFNLAVLNLNKDLNKSIYCINTLIKKSPEYPGAYFLRGYIHLYYNHDAQSALNDFNKAIEIDSVNSYYRIIRGLTYLKSKKNINGINELLHVVNLKKVKDYSGDFENSPYKQILSDLLSQVATYSRYEYLMTPTEQDLFKEALGSFFHQNYSNADKIYKKLLKNSELEGLVYYLKGYNLEKHDFPEIILSNYKKSIKCKNYPLESYLRKGNALLSISKFKEAIDCLNFFISKNDSVKFAFRCRGIAYVKLFKFDSALIDFSKFLLLDSTDLDIIYNRAICYKQLGNFKEAANDFSIVCYYNNNDETSHYELAECQFYSGDKGSALKTASECIRRGYFDPRLYYLRALIFLDMNKFEYSIADFNKYAELFPSDKGVCLFRAKAYFGKGEYFKSLRDYNSILEVNKNDISALIGRGLVYLKLKKNDLAYIDLHQAELLGSSEAKKTIEESLKEYSTNK